ncbi:MAG: general secretion pathway protein GspB [Planctomycetaceae bacterium]
MSARHSSADTSARAAAASPVHGRASGQPVNQSGDPTLRRKLGLIAILACILIGLLYRNVRNSNAAADSSVAAAAVDSPVTSPTDASTPTSASASSATTAIPTSASCRPKLELPKISLAEIVKYNPFRSPVLTPPEPELEPVAVAAVAVNVAETDVLPDPPPAQLDPQVKVSAYLERNGQRMAMVDGRIVREGDALGDGLRVLAIRRDGIVVERHQSPAGTAGAMNDR